MGNEELSQRYGLYHRSLVLRRQYARAIGSKTSVQVLTFAGYTAQLRSHHHVLVVDIAEGGNGPAGVVVSAEVII